MMQAGKSDSLHVKFVTTALGKGRFTAFYATLI